MPKNRFLLLLLSPLMLLQSQVLEVKERIGNASAKINDGFIELEVSGGVPPYTYKWSDQNTALDAAAAYGLMDGIPYHVEIRVSNGNSISRSYEIQPEKITEYFNSAAVPLVDKLGAFLFWDPFSAIDVYDPIVYADVKKVPISGWDPTVKDKFVLREWKVSNDDLVSEGDLIAVVESEKKGTIYIHANTTGNITQLAKKGEVIYDSENTKDVIEVGAHNLAEIEYTE